MYQKDKQNKIKLNGDFNNMKIPISSVSIQLTKWYKHIKFKWYTEMTYLRSEG